MICRLRAFMSLAVAFALCADIDAAVLARVNLQSDGAIEPPGDRIAVTVIFLPGETELTVDVRVFARLEMGQSISAVVSRDPQQADDAGNLWISKVIRRKADTNAASVDIVVPYASMKLPEGIHELAYEITGRRDDEIDFVKATEMNAVVVSQQTRTSMLLAQDTLRYVERQTTRTAIVVEDNGISERQVQIATPKPLFAFQQRSVAVNIPGEFSRPMMAKAMLPREKPVDEDTLAAIPLEGQAWESLAKFEPKRNRTIFYATNREVIAPDERSPARFGNTVGELSFGACTINIPIEHHTKGSLEVPSWWNSRDPANYFLVESLDPLDIQAFRQQTSKDDILLFVHGYNTNFKFAVLRTGQLVHDLAFPGHGVSFSWPSTGRLTGYFQDETVAQASVPALVQLFTDLQETATSEVPEPETPERKIHIIAHSMGNRVLLQAMRYFELQQSQPREQKLFGQVALAAPDVSGALFGALIPSLVRQADHVTLYYCEADQALQASREVHQDKPVGLGPCFAEGVDTINADAVNTDVIGHGYYASAHELLTDLRLYLVNRLPPDDRLPPLGKRTEVIGFSHWAFAPPQ
ncbi:MAG: alpha/beta fold hydrolase [Planctomycetaceae bacterium]|nr:alpha/beta fold hydrolase [Planctomycetales bacterium]MCB9872740.1 alpha/beta fold hydrolase [Planctomycetaceae bacterium]MCB9926226.1 alpha/beta fold hydrolase [Planctomycetaceae bacterium]